MLLCASLREGSDSEVRWRRQGRRHDVRPHLLQDCRDAHRRKDARDGDIGRLLTCPKARRGEREVERASVSEPGWAENGAFIAIVAAEALEVLRLLDAVAVGIEDAAGDDQRVARVLLEDLFGLHVEGIRVPVPNGSVDPDYPAGVG